MNFKQASGWSLWKKAAVISATLVPGIATADAGNTPSPQSVSTSNAAAYASPERQDIAVGHYARARALLVEALAEFEQARSVARPDLLLDPEDWRLTIISKTEELNRLLDPQPRVTRSGVKYKANKALIRTDRSASRASLGGAQDSNYAGEAQIEKELGLYKSSTKPEIDDAIASKTIPPAVKSIEVPKIEGGAEPSSKAKVLVSPKEEQERSETLGKIEQLKTPSEQPAKSVAGEKPEAAKLKPEEIEAAEEASKLREKLKEARSAENLPTELEADAEKASTATKNKDPLFNDATAIKKDGEDLSKKISAAEKENLEMSKAIEDAIKARLKKVNSMAEPPIDDAAIGKGSTTDKPVKE